MAQSKGTWLHPWDTEKLSLLKAIKKIYPAKQSVPNQSIGNMSMGCGATHGVYERCNFGCTACYLGKNANSQPPMPFEQVLEQLQQLRRHLGPRGNVQITSGEVTLLPVDQLLRIVRAAIDLDLSPMLMSHGDTFLHDPAYLEKLVQGGLRKVALHVDITQRGRKGLSKPESELQLNQVRDRMVALIQGVRNRTGKPLNVSLTITVNRENLDQIHHVIQWFLQQPGVFRMVSFQPQAATGRTRDDGSVSADEVWDRLEAALGVPVNPHPIQFGHSACNRLGLIVHVQTGKKPIFIQPLRANHPMDDRLVADFMRDFTGVNFNRTTLQCLPAVFGMLLRKPQWLIKMPVYLLRRSWQERGHIPAIIAAALRLKLRIRSLSFVVHAFMGREEINTPLGKERLEACVFKLPVNGEMVSMCEMNGTDVRESTYQNIGQTMLV